MSFQEIHVAVPKSDCDVIIDLPGGKHITVQLRPGNADVNYNGSLDILLPENTAVTCWKGFDMEDAPEAFPKKKRLPHIRLAQQLVCELPGDYSALDDGGLRAIHEQNFPKKVPAGPEEWWNPDPNGSL